MYPLLLFPVASTLSTFCRWGNIKLDSWCATYVITQNCSHETITKTEDFIFGACCKKKNFNLWRCCLCHSCSYMWLIEDGFSNSEYYTEWWLGKWTLNVEVRDCGLVWSAVSGHSWNIWGRPWNLVCALAENWTSHLPITNWKCYYLS